MLVTSPGFIAVAFGIPEITLPLQFLLAVALLLNWS